MRRGQQVRNQQANAYTCVSQTVSRSRTSRLDGDESRSRWSPHDPFFGDACGMETVSQQLVSAPFNVPLHHAEVDVVMIAVFGTYVGAVGSAGIGPAGREYMPS